MLLKCHYINKLCIIYIIINVIQRPAWVKLLVFLVISLFRPICEGFGAFGELQNVVEAQLQAIYQQLPEQSRRP